MGTIGKFHSQKIYVPKGLRDMLGLEDGAEVEFTITEKGEVVIKVLKADADRKLLEILARPRNLGIKGKLSRDEIYATA